jgi:hypothetical protein
MSLRTIDAGVQASEDRRVAYAHGSRHHQTARPGTAHSCQLAAPCARARVGHSKKFTAFAVNPDLDCSALLLHIASSLDGRNEATLWAAERCLEAAHGLIRATLPTLRLSWCSCTYYAPPFGSG